MSSAFYEALSAEVRRLVTEAGAERVGICRAEAVDEHERELYRRWVQTGNHAGMDYMERNMEVRDDPRTLLEGARSLVIALFPYPCSDKHVCGVPYIASYARGRDYHRVLKRRLAAVTQRLNDEYGVQSRVCVDSAPLRERYWARRAGLGFSGLNGRLFAPGLGCDFFIATIVTTAVLIPDHPATDLPSTCLECGRCVKACPNGALDGHGGLDARRCISYQTIENRGDIPKNLDLAGHVFGCDICSAVCPLATRPEGVTPIADLMERPEVKQLTVSDWLTMDTARYESLFNGTAVRRASLEKLLGSVRKINDDL